VLPLDATAHDHLLPELSGASQAQLFAVGSEARPQTLGSSLRKQVLLPVGPARPEAGDLLLFLHGDPAVAFVRLPRHLCVHRHAHLRYSTGALDVCPSGSDCTESPLAG